VLVLSVPGPCTTFSGVQAPAGCDAGISFEFSAGPSTATCQNIANTQCCQVLSNCDINCTEGIACINACSIPRTTTSSCVMACFGSHPGLVGTVTTLSKCFYTPDGGSAVEAGANACIWLTVPPSSSED
jgi:hypothetical protein